MVICSYSWPVFWHVFGNKYPILDSEAHVSKDCNVYRWCFYCMLEKKARELLFGNNGVRIIRHSRHKVEGTVLAG